MSAKRRLIGGIAILVALGCGVFAGGASGGSEGTAAVSGKIRVLVSTAQQRSWQILIPNFQRVYPNVEVDAQYVGGGGAGQAAVLLPQLQAGSGPDVMILYPGSGTEPSVVSLARAGHLDDLSKSPWVKRDPAWIKSLTNFNKKTYMLELGVQVTGVLYNVDQFKQLGLTVPKTFSQLVALCRSIKQKAPGKTPIAIPFGNATLSAPVLMMFAGNWLYGKDPTWNSRKSSGKASFAGTSGWRTALARFLAMKDAGCFSAGAAADGLPQVISQYASERALMSMGFSAMFGSSVAANSKITSSIFPLPGDTAQATWMTTFPGNGIGVNSRSPNKAAAHAFVDFMARVKQNNLFAKVDGGLIAPYDFNKASLPDLYKPLAPLVPKSISSPHYLWPTGATFTALGTSGLGLLTGQKTVEQVLADVDASWGK